MNKFFAILIATAFVAASAFADVNRSGGFEAVAGVGVTSTLRDDFSVVVPDFDEPTYSAGLKYWFAKNHSLGVTVSAAEFPTRLWASELDYRYNFRSTKRFVPFLGVSYGLVNNGLITDDVKQLFGAFFGANVYFNRVGFFVESRGLNVFDRDVTDVSARSLLGRTSVGVVLLAK